MGGQGDTSPSFRTTGLMLFMDLLMLRPVFGLHDFDTVVLTRHNIPPKIVESLDDSLVLDLPAVSFLSVSDVRLIVSAQFP
jgi:hypothetical protein